MNPQAPDQPQVAPSTDHTIRELLQILWRGRWIILVCVLLGTAFGIRKIQQDGTIWKAEARLFVDGQAPDVLSLDGMVTSTKRNFVNTQAAIMRSYKVLQEVVAKPEIASSPIFEDELNKVGALKLMLSVAVGRTDDTITVAIESDLVVEACDIVNSIVEEYRRSLSLKNQDNVKLSLDVLADRKEKDDEDLRAKQKDIDTFQEANPLFISLEDAGGITFVSEQLREFGSQKTEAKRAVRLTAAELEEAQLLTDRPEMLREFVNSRGLLPSKDLAVPDDSLLELDVDIADLRSTVRSLHKIRTELLHTRNEHHPAIVQATKDLADVQTSLAAQQEWRQILGSEQDQADTEDDQAYVALILARLELRLNAAQTRLNEESEDFEAQSASNLKWANQRKEHTRLMAALTRAELKSDATADLIERFLDQELAGDTSSLMTVEVLDHASLVTATKVSRRALTLALFAFMGLFAGTGISWIRSQLDHRLRSPDDLAQASDLPILATIPRTPQLDNEDNSIHVWAEQAELAEAARSLRTAVYFGMTADQGQVLQITSAQKSEGKSTISTLLSIAFAQAGQRTLLIDADLRSPSVARMLRLGNDKGLSNILAEGAAVSKLIQSTRIEGLDVLTSGPRPSNPAEMLNSHSFSSLLKQLGVQYDRVIVDTAPVLAVTDSPIVATVCDATVFVVRMDKTTGPDLRHAIERIQSVGGKLLGLALNDMPRTLGYGYGYSYGSYGYGDPPAAGSFGGDQSSAIALPSP